MALLAANGTVVGTVGSGNSQMHEKADMGVR